MEEFGPILEPDPIGFSLDAPGWSYLGLVLAGAMLTLAVRWIFRYQKYAYRRAAIAQVNITSEVRGINVILKSLALKSFDRAEVAPLFGQSWIEFLLDKLDKHTFKTEDLTHVLAISWQNEKPAAEKLEQFKQFSIYWISNYHV